MRAEHLIALQPALRRDFAGARTKAASLATPNVCTNKSDKTSCRFAWEACCFHTSDVDGQVPPDDTLRTAFVCLTGFHHGSVPGYAQRVRILREK